MFQEEEASREGCWGGSERGLFGRSRKAAVVGQWSGMGKLGCDSEREGGRERQQVSDGSLKL